MCRGRGIPRRERRRLCAAVLDPDRCAGGAVLVGPRPDADRGRGLEDSSAAPARTEYPWGIARTTGVSRLITAVLVRPGEIARGAAPAGPTGRQSLLEHSVSIAAALLPQLRMRPGSRSCDLDGMAWVGGRYLSRIMTERDELARNIVRRHTSRSSKAMHSRVAYQPGHGQVSHARESFPAHPRRSSGMCSYPVSMPIVLTATAFLPWDMAASSSCFEALPDRQEHRRVLE
jgi:hypothetical protein